MRKQSEATLYLREAEAYLASAKLLHGDALGISDDPMKWTNRNPMYFLVLHAAELAAKACLLARHQRAPHTHDIVKLFRETGLTGSRSCFRRTYRNARDLRVRRIKEKWSRDRSEFADAAMRVEIEEEKVTPLLLMENLRQLGALGQSEMTKLEWGEELKNWFHGARYPRLSGTTSYPAFEICTSICEGFINRASEETGCA